MFTKIVSQTIILVVFINLMLFSQQRTSYGKDQQSQASFKNPVLHADYSDPDVIRVDEDYYMISSSFHHVPGLPLLHSKNLADWHLVGNVLPRLIPEERYEKVHHGSGVWAPSLRFHDSTFYIYYPDPDVGIFMTKTQKITGPWSEPVLVEAGKGLIDPCPLWDDDGRVYLVHAYAGSRASLKTILVIKEMNESGTKIIGPTVMIYDGHENDPTVEGPKIHKHNGFYYVFAPAGGVSTGWQLVLRSKHIYGPYERRVVLHQGNTDINGPHQGAWVDGHDGKHWFVHFQDKEAYGRIVHLQPLHWNDGWPVVGYDPEKDGIGVPVSEYFLPGNTTDQNDFLKAMSDEFDQPVLSPQWQWQANPKSFWAMPTTMGFLRLYPTLTDSKSDQVWMLPNLLAQKFPAETFTATTKIDIRFRQDGERLGFGVFGLDLAFLECKQMNGQNILSFRTQKNVEDGAPIQTETSVALSGESLLIKIVVGPGAVCRFFYSEGGNRFISIGSDFVAKPGKWVGAKIGYFTTRNSITNDMGWVDLDWFRY